MIKIQLEENLFLETVKLSMAAELFELTQKNKTHLEPWMTWASSDSTISTTEDFIKSAMLLEANNDGVTFAIIYYNKLIGIIGTHNIDFLNCQTSVGYWIDADLQGKGIVTKSLVGVINFIFNKFGLNRIEVRCSVKNKKSRDIPERLGFKLDGYMTEGECVNKEFRDLAVYSITKNNWQVKRLNKDNILYVAPVMPSSDIKRTKEFFKQFEMFEISEFDDYLILRFDNFELHYFKYEVNPLTNYCGCYVRTLRIDDMYEFLSGYKVIHPNGELKVQPWGLKEFAIIDPDNNLIKIGERVR